MGTIMVPVNGDLIYAAARDMGLKMTQLSEKLGMRDRDYVSHSARKGKMSLKLRKNSKEFYISPSSQMCR